MDILDVVCLLVFNCLAVTRTGSQSLYFCNTNGIDPCEVANSREPFEPEARFVNCDYSTYSSFCDRYITPGWYRYKSNMLDRCPSLLNCGALYPNWLNGSHPASVNTEVVRTACKVGFSSCCASQVTIKIRHCGLYMAYCLPALDSCPTRYCFGETGECNAASESVSSTTFVQSTTSSQFTKTSTQRTTLPQFSVSQSTRNTDQSTTSTQPTSSTDKSTTSKQPTTITYKSTTSTQSTIRIGGQSITSTQFSISSSAPGKWTSSAAQTSNVPTTTSSLNEQCIHDPCDPRYIENIPNLVNRSNECIYDSTLRPCDLEIKSVWYTGFHLLNKCPDFLRCGAVYPVWMNGSEPTVKDGIVTRQACKVAPNECCAEKFEIKVVNCSLFTAYCLTPLRRCEERYCFDTKTCSTKPKKQETSVDVPEDASFTTYIVLAVVAVIIIISIAIFLLLFRYMRRKQTDETYEVPKPAPAQPENPYEMPVISDVNHGNVYDELPSRQEDTDYQTVEEHYVNDVT